MPKSEGKYLVFRSYEKNICYKPCGDWCIMTFNGLRFIYPGRVTHHENDIIMWMKLPKVERDNIFDSFVMSGDFDDGTEVKGADACAFEG